MTASSYDTVIYVVPAMSRALFPSANLLKGNTKSEADDGDKNFPSGETERSNDWYRSSSYKASLTVHSQTSDGNNKAKKVRSGLNAENDRKKKRRRHEKQSKMDYQESSSDFSDAEVTTALTLLHKPNEHEHKYYTDRRGDSELLLFGAAYHLDIPVYSVVDCDSGSVTISSDDLARREHKLPSGLVKRSSNSQHYQRDRNDIHDNVFDKKDRYYSRRKTQLWRDLFTPVYRSVRESKSGATYLPSFIAVAGPEPNELGENGPRQEGEFCILSDQEVF